MSTPDESLRSFESNMSARASEARCSASGSPASVNALTMVSPAQSRDDIRNTERVPTLTFQVNGSGSLFGSVASGNFWGVPSSGDIMK